MKASSRGINPFARHWKILVLVLIVVIGLFSIIALKLWQEEPEAGIPEPHLPEVGEKITLHVFAGYKNHIPVENVEITFIEGETGDTHTQITDNEGISDFSVTIGNTYTITATFRNSTKSVTSIIGPKHRVSVLLEDNTIKSIKIYEVGII